MGVTTQQQRRATYVKVPDVVVGGRRAQAQQEDHDEQMNGHERLVHARLPVRQVFLVKDLVQGALDIEQVVERERHHLMVQRDATGLRVRHQQHRKKRARHEDDGQAMPAADRVQEGHHEDNDDVRDDDQHGPLVRDMTQRRYGDQRRQRAADGDQWDDVVSVPAAPGGGTRVPPADEADDRVVDDGQGEQDG